METLKIIKFVKNIQQKTNEVNLMSKKSDDITKDKNSFRFFI